MHCHRTLTGSRIASFLVGRLELSPEGDTVVLHLLPPGEPGAFSRAAVLGEGLRSNAGPDAAQAGSIAQEGTGARRGRPPKNQDRDHYLVRVLAKIIGGTMPSDEFDTIEALALSVRAELELDKRDEDIADPRNLERWLTRHHAGLLAALHGERRNELRRLAPRRPKAARNTVGPALQRGLSQ